MKAWVEGSLAYVDGMISWCMNTWERVIASIRGASKHVPLYRQVLFLKTLSVQLSS